MKITEDGSPCSGEVHQVSVERGLLCIATEWKICSDGPIITSDKYTFKMFLIRHALSIAAPWLLGHIVLQRAE